MRSAPSTADLQPRTLVAMVASWEGVWRVAGLVFLSASAIQETAIACLSLK